MISAVVGFTIGWIVFAGVCRWVGEVRAYLLWGGGCLAMLARALYRESLGECIWWVFVVLATFVASRSASSARKP